MFYGLIYDKLNAKIEIIFEMHKFNRKNLPKTCSSSQQNWQKEQHKNKKPCNPEGLQGHPIVGVDGFEPPTLCL